MSHEPKGLYGLGGAAFVVSGILFLSRAVLEFIAGPPPSNGTEILAWVESHKLVLSFVSEILFFGAMALVPAVVALHHSLAGVDRVKAATGSGIIAVAIPVIAVLLIVHGRLVYPVYGIRVGSPDVAENIVAVFYGGMHAVYLMMALATFVVSLAMLRKASGKRVAYLGFATALVDVIGAYPDAIGPVLTLVSQVFFAAWLVAIGSILYRERLLIVSAATPGDVAPVRRQPLSST